jgi:hypothetical protein
MNCNVIQDLIPLYIDGCCSAESAAMVQQHLAECPVCQKLYIDMTAVTETVSPAPAPTALRPLGQWKASVLQSILLFVSFAVITIGVATEAGTPWGDRNGYWAFNTVVPATGFLLSLASWYFVRLFKSKRQFSTCSALVTLGITLCCFIWTAHHYYGILFFIALFTPMGGLGTVIGLLELYWIGIALSVACCLLSKLLSGLYAGWIGKE